MLLEVFVTDSTNLLIIMSDEHNPKMLGCAGHPVIQTPNLDALAATGTTFEAAYCNSPVCIPARATFATGRYIHDIGFFGTMRSPMTAQFLVGTTQRARRAPSRFHWQASFFAAPKTITAFLTPKFPCMLSRNLAI